MLFLFLPLFLILSCQSIGPQNPNKETLQPEITTAITQKQSVRARRHMVSAAHPLASQAGLDVLNQGGNALDAAIAAQMALNVAEPQSSGIGGGGLLLYYDAKARVIHAYDGRETAPAAVTPDIFLDASGKPKAFYDALVGGLSVGVPGVLRMLEMAHREHGKLAWRELFAPGIKLAREGVPFSERSRENARVTPNLNAFEPTRRHFFNADGKTPKDAGEIIFNPELAKTFELIAQNGADAFYTGDIARDIVATVTNAPLNPGRLTLQDLAAYRPKKPRSSVWNTALTKSAASPRQLPEASPCCKFWAFWKIST